MNKIKIVEISLYLLMIGMVFFILGNYKYQPSLSADELEAVEELKELKVAQEGFVEKNEYELANIDLTDYKVDTGYSDLLLLIQDLLQLDVVSGYYNEETERAIRELQATHKLKETGTLDEASFVQMMKTTLPISETELNNYHEVVRLLQRELNVDADGLLGDTTTEAIKELKKELDTDEPALVDDAVLGYVIDRLDS